jgi:hypothetical protein
MKHAVLGLIVHQMARSALLGDLNFDPKLFAYFNCIGLSKATVSPEKFPCLFKRVWGSDTAVVESAENKGSGSRHFLVLACDRW